VITLNAQRPEGRTFARKRLAEDAARHKSGGANVAAVFLETATDVAA
jgi:hypothetical protein